MRQILPLTCVALLAGNVACSAAVHKTYTTTADIQWYSCGVENCAVQSFAVGPGERLLAVEFYVSDSGVDDPAYNATLALYSGYCGVIQPPQVARELVQAISVSSTQIAGGTWVEMVLTEPVESGLLGALNLLLKKGDYGAGDLVQQIAIAE